MATTESTRQVRVMFCIGGLPALVEAGREELQTVIKSFVKTRGDLLNELNITVRATFDDDQLKEGPTGYGQYIIVDAPDLDSIVSYVTGLMRAPIDGLDAFVFKYFSIETRIGRPLGVSAGEHTGQQPGPGADQINGVI